MEILILGGTRFFGPALIAKLYEKTAGSAQITCFHRALHGGTDAFGQVKHIIGNLYDRQAVTSVFRERRDLVVDLSGTDEEMIGEVTRNALKMLDLAETGRLTVCSRLTEELRTAVNAAKNSTGLQ